MIGIITPAEAIPPWATLLKLRRTHRQQQQRCSLLLLGVEDREDGEQRQGPATTPDRDEGRPHRRSPTILASGPGPECSQPRHYLYSRTAAAQGIRDGSSDYCRAAQHDEVVRRAEVEESGGLSFRGGRGATDPAGENETQRANETADAAGRSCWSAATGTRSAAPGSVSMVEGGFDFALLRDIPPSTSCWIF